MGGGGGWLRTGEACDNGEGIKNQASKRLNFIKSLRVEGCLVWVVKMRSKFAVRPVMLTIKENSRERQDAQTHKFRRTAR